MACWLVLSVWSGSAASQGAPSGEAYGSGRNAILDLYQRYISPARGSRCGMHPSCSQYAKLAFSRLPPMDAYLAVTDRLLRCSQDAKTYPVRYVGGMGMSYDPPPSGKPTEEEISLPVAVPATVLAAATPNVPPAASAASPVEAAAIAPPSASLSADAASPASAASAAPAAPAASIAPAAPVASGAALPPWLEELQFSDLALLEYARAYSGAAGPADKEAGLRGMAVCLRSRGDYRGLARLHRYV